MGSHLLQILQIAAIVVGLATGAGYGLQRGVVKNLREIDGDREKRVHQLEKERVEDKATIARLESDLSALKRVVTNEVGITAMTDLLDHHHRDAQDAWRRGEDLLMQILGHLK